VGELLALLLGPYRGLLEDPEQLLPVIERGFVVLAKALLLRVVHLDIVVGALHPLGMVDRGHEHIQLAPDGRGGSLFLFPALATAYPARHPGLRVRLAGRHVYRGHGRVLEERLQVRDGVLLALRVGAVFQYVLLEVVVQRLLDGKLAGLPAPDLVALDQELRETSLRLSTISRT